jgi:hypothetical protein
MTRPIPQKPVRILQAKDTEDVIKLMILKGRITPKHPMFL